MLFGVLIESMTGAVCIVLGVLLWKKQKISLLHDYHYRHVKEADVPAYARQMGIGLLIIGAGIMITGLLDLVRSTLWWIPFLAGFLMGLAVMYRAQKKYNGSIFG